VITLDTSVAVAAALPWHEFHAVVREALPRRKTTLIAQVGIETYSVLTRLPPPQRVPAPVALDYLKQSFALPPIVLPADGYPDLLNRAAARGIAGGAVYDGLVAVTAQHAGATLLTLDRRAVTTYEQLGVSFELVG